MAHEAPAKERLAAKIKKQGTAAAPIDLCDFDDSDNPQEEEMPASGAAAVAAGVGAGEVGGKKKKAKASQGGPLYQVKWHRIVLDEAQSIKNSRTLAANAAWGLVAQHRWCLSGTPIQNSLDDLFSYFRYDTCAVARIWRGEV
jgi:hypothetical protein